MAYVLYFRRHRRADLLLAYVTLNIGIFVAMSLLSTVRVDIALGFGLFAILSIIRLRSSAVTQQEVAYYFVALVMGLVNGMNLDDRWLVVLVNVLLLLTMFVVDSRPLRDRARRMDVTLDVVHADDAALVADLERRLGGRVMHHVVNEVDYVRDTMVVDVRYRAGPRIAAGLDDAPGHATTSRSTTPRWQSTRSTASGSTPSQARLRTRQPQYATGRSTAEPQSRPAGHGGAAMSAATDVPRHPGPGRHPRRAGGGRGRRDGRPDRAERAERAGRAADPGGPQVLRARRRLPPADRRAGRRDAGARDRRPAHLRLRVGLLRHPAT